MFVSHFKSLQWWQSTLCVLETHWANIPFSSTVTGVPRPSTADLCSILRLTCYFWVERIMNGVNLLGAHQFPVKNTVNHYFKGTEPINPSVTPVSDMLGHEQACCTCGYDTVLLAAECIDYSWSQIIHKNSPTPTRSFVDMWTAKSQLYLEAII